MRKSVRSLSGLALVVGMSVMLAGCAGASGSERASSASPTPPATISASPTPTVGTTPTEVPPTAEPALPASILIGAEATDIVDADGDVLLSLRYDEDGDAAVSAATEVLGQPTETKSSEQTPHYAAADGTFWGGFAIWIERRTEEAEPPMDDYSPEFFVQTDTAEALPGVAIAAVDGTQVGDAASVAGEGKPAEEVHNDETFGVTSVTLDLPESFPGIVEGVDRSYGVIGVTEANSDTFEYITAPTYLYSVV